MVSPEARLAYKRHSAWIEILMVLVAAHMKSLQIAQSLDFFFFQVYTLISISIDDFCDLLRNLCK